MRIIGESYDGDLNPTGVTCEDDGQEYRFEIVRHGRWEKEDTLSQMWYRCSICHSGNHIFLSAYCPDCGAKMDGKPHEKGR